MVKGSDNVSNGWIKLHRKLQECWIWLEKEPFDKRSAWVDLLLTANHSDKKILFNGELITVKRGQILTSIRKLAERWKWSYDKTSRFLKLIESDGMLRKESDNCRTLITIENYEVYQDMTCTDRTPTSEPTEHQQVNLPNACRTPISEPISDKQECKEDKNVKNKIYTCAFEDFWKAYPRKKDKGNAFKKFNARLNSGFSEEELIESAKNYADECQRNHTETKYIKHPATFLSDSTPFIDYLKGGDCDGRTGRNDKTIQVRDEYAEEFERLLSE